MAQIINVDFSQRGKDLYYMQRERRIERNAQKAQELEEEKIQKAIAYSRKQYANL